MDHLRKSNISSPLLKSTNKKRKKSFFQYPLLLIIIISFFIGSVSAAAISLIINGLISEGSFGKWGNVFNIEAKPDQKNHEVIIKEKIVDEESATIEMVKNVSPSVVSIIVTKEISQYFNPWSIDDFFDWPFSFEIPKPKQEPKKEKRQIGGGSGFVVSSDGLILTNKHVVSDSTAEYTIITNEGKSMPAKILAQDPLNDIAVIKVEAKNLPEIKLGDSSKIQIGQSVVAIGFALGEFKNTVTKGVISGIGRKIMASGGGRTELLEDVIQTDAAINPGNSGGPLLNLRGEVIGINTAISLEGQLIGFAIPINLAKSVIESVKKFGRIVRPFLGIRYILLNETIAKENNLSVDYGALIIRGEKVTDLAVMPGSAADKAGLQENDIILELNGEKITPEKSLAKMIQKFKPGDEITLKVLSKGKEKFVKVVLDEYKE